MKSFIFKRSLFSEIWFEDILLEDEEKELIRILYNKPEPEYQVEEKSTGRQEKRGVNKPIMTNGRVMMNAIRFIIKSSLPIR